MSYYLEMFFAYGSYLLQLVCLACCGLACWRLSKVLGERSFALAAIAIGIFVGLHVLLTMVQYLGGFIPADIWARLYQATFLLYYAVHFRNPVLGAFRGGGSPLRPAGEARRCPRSAARLSPSA